MTSVLLLNASEPYADPAPVGMVAMAARYAAAAATLGILPGPSEIPPDED